MTRINAIFQKWMPLIAPLSVVLGIMFSELIKEFTIIVPWIFAFMTFSGSLHASFSDIKKVLLQPWTMLICMLLLHVLIPLLAWAMGHLVFAHDPLTMTGLVLAFVIPTGVSSFVWVSMFKGNTALTLSTILIDTLISPFIVPYTLYWLVGEKVHIDIWGIMSGLMWMVVLPSIAGMVWQEWSHGRAREKWGPVLAPFSKVGLATVILLNSAIVAPFFQTFSWKMIWLLVTVFLLASCGYIAGWLTSKLLRYDQGTLISVTLNSGMRNISAGAVLAMQYFAPAVALPVVCGMLFQQVLASISTAWIRKAYDRKQTLATADHDPLSI